MYGTGDDGGSAPRRTGLWRRLRLRLARRHPDADEVIAHRVKAALAEATGFPAALTVGVRDGRVTLRGAALATEEPALLQRARTVRGVKTVENCLELHGTANVPQSQDRARGRRLILHPTWLAYIGLMALGLAATVGVIGSRAHRPRSSWFRLRRCA